MNIICKLTDLDIGEKYIEINNSKIRTASMGIVIRDDGKIAIFKTYIVVDISSFAEKWGKELVKKTVNIPKWVNTKAESLKINFSKTLEEALLQKIYTENK